MTGLGKWQGTVNVQILKVTGDVTVEISDNGGKYDVKIELPEKLSKVKLIFDTIEEQGDDTLVGKGSLITPLGRSLKFSAQVSFNGDEFGGFLKISLATINIKNGHRI